ncbi:MAG: L-lactate dehydrogenase [Candidatus Promineifilaceae bacterium]|nr:L-lactate dehydrogenase [Candidatus Promineifilaceae bacterium]
MRIGIVGAGFVGSTAAYAMVMSGVGREIILVDKNTARAKAEAADILHAVPFAHPLTVRAGDYSDLAGCRVVIMSAGVSQRPGESRLELLERNAAIFRQVIPQIFEQAPQAVLVVATNPVDIMTHLSARYARAHGIPSQRVIGSGTTLDTARYRALLGQYLGVDANHIHGYVVGEHGDTEVLTWSLTNIGNMPLDRFCALRGLELNDEICHEIDQAVRQAAYRIIDGKGATYYGVGSALARIVENIVNDRRAIMTVCTPMEDVVGVQQVTVSLPHLIGGEGALETFALPLNEEETEALRHSANTIRTAIEELDAADTETRD